MELTDSQKLVITTENKSLLVSASAGSGKTFVVVQRIVDSIKNGQDVSRLLLLTFTNAAAAELKERLVAKLYELKCEYDACNDAKNAMRIAKQISKVPMADISTIHSFCLNVIRNNFYILGVDPNVTTLDATKAVILLKQAIVETIEEEYEESSENFLDILDIMGSEENLINTLYSLYLSYEQKVDKKMWFENSCKNYSLISTEVSDLTQTSFGNILFSTIKEKLMMLNIQLNNVIEDLDGIDEFGTRREMLKNICSNINKACKMETYNEVFEYMPTLLNLGRLPSNKVSDEELKEKVKQIKTKVADELNKLSLIMYKDTNGVIEELNLSSKYMIWLYTTIEKVEERYSNFKKEKQAIDFSDYEQLTLKVLEDENIRNKYTEKYEYIYIDEYQDTSSIQEAIISKISKDNNVIMVGDVKQSIYGFRNAKPELFISKSDKFKEISQDNLIDEKQGKIILSQNFRSRQEIINSINSVFNDLMSTNFGGANYSEEALVYGHGYETSENDTYKTELHIIEKEDNIDGEDEGDVIQDINNIKLEAISASKRINELLNSDFKVYDLKSKTYRKCEYKDIVILMRSTQNKANIVSDILNENNIPAYADSKTGFYKSDEISLIISFLKILNNSFDDIAMASVMYSIIGNFDLDELTKIRQNTRGEHIIESLNIAMASETLTNEKMKIKNFLELIGRFKEYLDVYKLSEILIKLYNETGIYESLRLDEQGMLKCMNLDSFVQIVYDFENSENVATLGSLIQYIDILKDKESSSDSPKLLGENENVVRIMTIHKSKGLEFPVVFLLDAGAKYNEQDVKDKLLTDDMLGVGMDIFNKDLNITYPSVIKQAIKLKTKKALRAEALRVLYVAFTRAKEKLIVFATTNSLEKCTKDIIQIDNKENSELLASSNNSYLKCILQAIIKENKYIDIKLHKAIDYIDCNDEGQGRLPDRKISRIDVFKDMVKQNYVHENKEEIEKIKSRLQQFENKDRCSDINQKYSVSELKKSETANSIDLKEYIPSVVKSKISSTSYGTFIHKVIEKLDLVSLEDNKLKDLINKIACEENVQNKINVEETQTVILNMYKTLRCFFEGAKCIKKELEFVIKDDLKSIPEVAFNFPTLIQGIVDMYIVTKDNKHVVIDFKTDKVDNVQEYLRRYSLQLRIYKKALEIGYETKIDNMYIYSFRLNELIEVVD